MILRLDKFLSSQSLISRKQAQALIKSGVCAVNGICTRQPDAKIDPGSDLVSVNGKTFEYKQFIYIMMNKPKGIISASNDPKAETVIDLLPPGLRRKGLFPAGRLDKDTTGLLIITDDGAFAHKMLAPKSGIVKTYIAALDGKLSEKDIIRIEEGILIDGGEKCLPAKIRQIDEIFVEIKISEGKYHQIKRMMCTLGRQVLELQRVQIGALKADSTLKPGCSRLLTEEEVCILLKNV